MVWPQLGEKVAWASPFGSFLPAPAVFSIPGGSCSVVRSTERIAFMGPFPRGLSKFESVKVFGSRIRTGVRRSFRLESRTTRPLGHDDVLFTRRRGV